MRAAEVGAARHIPREEPRSLSLAEPSSRTAAFTKTHPSLYSNLKSSLPFLTAVSGQNLKTALFFRGNNSLSNVITVLSLDGPTQFLP